MSTNTRDRQDRLQQEAEGPELCWRAVPMVEGHSQTHVQVLGKPEKEQHQKLPKQPET